MATALYSPSGTGLASDRTLASSGASGIGPMRFVSTRWAAPTASNRRGPTSTRRVAETTRRRYTLGDTSLAEALDAERELADQHALLAQNKAAAASDLATLYKALGGGWAPRSGPVE